MTAIARLYEHAEDLGADLPAATALVDERTTAHLLVDGERVMAELAAAMAATRAARGEGDIDWTRGGEAP